MENARKCFQGKRDRHKSADIYRHNDPSTKTFLDLMLGMDLLTDDVLRVMGEEQFWKARRTIMSFLLFIDLLSFSISNIWFFLMISWYFGLHPKDKKECGHLGQANNKQKKRK